MSNDWDVMMGGSRKFRKVAGGPDNVFCCFLYRHQRISQSVVRTSLEKQMDPRGPIASRWESVPVFLRKPIAPRDFVHTCRSVHVLFMRVWY